MERLSDEAVRAVMTMMAAASAAQMAPAVAPLAPTVTTVALTTAPRIDFVIHHITVANFLKEF